MKNTKDIYEKFDNDNRLFDNARKKQQSAEKLLNLYGNKISYLVGLMRPLGMVIQESLGYFAYETYGPFGLNSDMSIRFYKTKEDMEKGKEKCDIINIIPTYIEISGTDHKTRLQVLNFDKPKESECTIERINEVGYESITITEETTLEEIMKYSYPFIAEESNENMKA